MPFQTHKTLIYLQNTLRYFWWHPRAFLPFIDSNATDSFKAHNGRNVLRAWNDMAGGGGVINDNIFIFRVNYPVNRYYAKQCNLLIHWLFMVTK